MLKALYGVAGLGPAQLARYLLKSSGGCALILDNKVHRVGVLPHTPSVIFSSLSQFLRHHSRVTKDHLAFVIGPPEELATLKGLLGLGYARLRNGHFAYTPLQEQDLIACLNEARATVPVKWHHEPVDQLMVHRTADGNDVVVNRVRSLVYTITDKESRVTVTTTVYKVLRSELPWYRAEALLSRLVNSTVLTRISNLMRSPEASVIRTAYKQYKQYPDKINRICKVTNVSAFTLRYLEAKNKALQRR